MVCDEKNKMERMTPRAKRVCVGFPHIMNSSIFIPPTHPYSYLSSSFPKLVQQLFVHHHQSSQSPKTSYLRQSSRVDVLIVICRRKGREGGM